MIERRTTVTSPPRPLQTGHPWGDDDAAERGFAGWVLLQVWDRGGRGIEVSTQWCGDAEVVLGAAAQQLVRVRQKKR